MTRRRGFTIVEIMVASTLLLLLLGIIAMVLRPAMRISSRCAVRFDLLSQGHLALGTVRTDLEASPLEGVRLHPILLDRFALTAHRLDSVSPDGQPVLEDRLRIYHWVDRELSVSERAEVPRNALCRPLLEDLELPSQAARRLAREVSEFRVSDANPATRELELPLSIRVVLEKPAESNSPPEKVTLERSVFLKNP